VSTEGMTPTADLLKAVREHPSCTAAQLADFAGVSRDRVHGLLAKLEKRGVIYRWKRPGTRAALWVAKRT
jgi:DNA-binding MarR family transcriptional regulator